ncbi:MAG: SRPBCC family protein [Myxococcota bacterium]|nr:SRPBCC family protein [Myxococcota bacterium]
MTSYRLPLIASTMTLILLIAAGDVYGFSFTTEEIARLQAGKTVKKPLSNSRKNGFYAGTGWAIIDAPAPVIWKALSDWNAYPRIFPRTVKAEELARKGDRALIRMELGYKILSIGYCLDVVSDTSDKKVAFNLVPDRPHDIEKTSGYWRLFPQKDGRTLVGYGIAVQVPAGIVAFLGDRLEKDLEGALIGLPKYLKRWIEGPEGNRYRTMTAKK